MARYIQRPENALKRANGKWKNWKKNMVDRLQRRN